MIDAGNAHIPPIGDAARALFFSPDCLGDIAHRIARAADAAAQFDCIKATTPEASPPIPPSRVNAALIHRFVTLRISL
jgi:hypothetical protein